MTTPQMVRLRDLGQWSGGNTPSKANPAYWTDGTIPWVSPKDMKVDEISASEDRITQEALDEGRVSMLPEGSILFVTRSGILAHTLPVAVTRVPVTVNQDLKALSPKAGVLPSYVAHAVRGASRRILKSCAKHGTTVASIDTNALLDFEIPMLDLDGQRTTVAEIERQFSRLDEAVANLQRVKASLKRYRAAVLRTAIEGRLVASGRGCGQDCADRHDSAQQPDFIGASAMPGSVRRGVPTEVSPSPVAARLRTPPGWSKSSTAELLRSGAIQDIKDGNHGSNHPRTEEFSASGLPFITATEVADFRIDYDGAYKIDGAPLARLKVGFAQPGDVILTHKGTVGRVALNVRACVLSPQTTYYRANVSAFLPQYLQYFLASPQFSAQLAEVKSQTTRDYVPISDQYRFFILRPPLGEQQDIVAEVERRLSIVRGVEAEIDANLKRALALRQAVLARAFCSEEL